MFEKQCSVVSEINSNLKKQISGPRFSLKGTPALFSWAARRGSCAGTKSVLSASHNVASISTTYKVNSWICGTILQCATYLLTNSWLNSGVGCIGNILCEGGFSTLLQLKTYRRNRLNVENDRSLTLTKTQPPILKVDNELHFQS